MHLLKNQYILMILYILAIVAANTFASLFGPSVTIVNAFVFIGLDMAIRDYLHDLYDEPLKPMFILVGIGSLCSYLSNAGMIAIASAVSFLIANSADTSIYHYLRKQSWVHRSLKSNIAASGIDSLLFPLIAFGSFMPTIVAGQWIAKIAGGIVFTVIFVKSGKQ